MPEYTFNKVRPDYARFASWGPLADQITAAALGVGVTVTGFSYNSGVITVVTDVALTGPQETGLGQIIAAYDFRDWAGESETAKVNAKDVLNDIEALYDVALTHYSGLTGQEKQAVLTTLTTGWASASAAQKADALRSLLSLIVVSIYFIYLKFINNGQ